MDFSRRKLDVARDIKNRSQIRKYIMICHLCRSSVGLQRKRMSITHASQQKTIKRNKGSEGEHSRQLFMLPTLECSVHKAAAAPPTNTHTGWSNANMSQIRWTRDLARKKKWWIESYSVGSWHSEQALARVRQSNDYDGDDGRYPNTFRATTHLLRAASRVDRETRRTDST